MEDAIEVIKTIIKLFLGFTYIFATGIGALLLVIGILWYLVEFAFLNLIILILIAAFITATAIVLIPKALRFIHKTWYFIKNDY